MTAHCSLSYCPADFRPYDSSFYRMFSLYLRVRKIYVNDKIPDPVDDGYVAFGVDQWVGGSLAYAVRRPRATPASGANTRCDRSPPDWTTPFCKQRCGDHR